MVSENEQLIKVLGMNSKECVLEIMSDEGKFTSLFAKNVGEIETIEVDPGMACWDLWKDLHSRVRNHFVFCGHPYDFLKKKIENKAKIDIIIVNADRMDRSGEIWSLIELLNPYHVILTYKELRIGEYNKRVMRACGFEIIEQEVNLNNGISKKFCVGRSSKRHSN